MTSTITLYKRSHFRREWSVERPRPSRMRRVQIALPGDEASALELAALFCRNVLDAPSMTEFDGDTLIFFMPEEHEFVLKSRTDLLVREWLRNRVVPREGYPLFDPDEKS